MASRQLVYKMLSTPACNQYDDAKIRTFLADVDIRDGRYTGQGAPPTRRYVIELLMRGSPLGVCSMQMPCMLFDADLPWANILEQAVKNWWVYEEHAGHDPALEWPPSIHSVHRFADVGDRGLSVLLTAWDEWAYVGVMRKIRLPLKSITFENKPFEIVLEFQWEVLTNTENRQFTF